MISVSVVKQSTYPVSAKKIKTAVAKLLTSQGIVSDSEVSVALVSESKMAGYVADYYGQDKAPHPVLSFPSAEIKGRFVLPPDEKKIQLGEIIISYDECVRRARKENRLIEAVVIEMAEHGALHLIGVHHD